MKFDQQITSNKRNIFLQNYVQIEAARLVPDFIFFLKKALFEVRASALRLSFNIFG